MKNEYVTGAVPNLPPDPFVAAWDKSTKGGAVKGLSKDDKAFIAEVERREKRGEAKRVSGKEGLRRIRERLKHASEKL